MGPSSVFKIVFCAVAVWISASHAEAATITYANTRPTGWPGDAFANVSYGTESLPQFDPSLGTLTGAIYRVDGDLTFTVTNSTDAALSGLYSFSVGLKLLGPGIITTPGSGAPFDVIINWANFEGPTTIDPGTMAHATHPDFTHVAGPALDPFIGTGMIAALIAVSEDSNICRNNTRPDGPFPTGLSCGQTEENFTTAITYTYDPAGDPVPEPASLALVMLGVLVPAVRRGK